ncbi:MAG: putative baseplate assembly protein, partial [Acidobacteria bacterium]|nr:putative baseplate assembly protein [Acidobacteriota bacterium]
MSYLCGSEERRNAVVLSPLNGIDFLEMIDAEAPADDLRQHLLALTCFKAVAGLTAAHARVEGGERIQGIRILWAFPLDSAPGELGELDPEERAFFATYRAGKPDREKVLVLRTDAAGDFSRYRLVLVQPGSERPPQGFDPRLSAVEFSFKAECPTDYDCKALAECLSEGFPEPQIDYLAKDYGSFRRLIFDRLATLAPQWRERGPADLGVALVELMAFTADRLSYFQDAVTTEAYLGTARRRISVRRHARLVDFTLHEGANARTWVCLTVGAAADGALLPGPDPATGRPGTALATGFEVEQGTVASPALPPAWLDRAVRGGAVVFETLHDLTLRKALNELRFYTWSEKECCLPAGATTATLRRPSGPGLATGTFLLFEEVLGRRSGAEADADPRRRHVVRLMEVREGVDPLDGTEVVEIAWDGADALPFPLSVSVLTDDAHGGRYVEDVSVARGNLVLADHGRSVEGELLPAVPVPSAGGGASPYRPVLAEGPVTHAVGLGVAGGSGPPALPAAELLRTSPEEALPAVLLESPAETWRPRRDLLASDRFQTEFVVEVDDEGRARLRFGDDVHGRRPSSGAELTARYRVGGGAVGNVGAEALRHVFLDQAGIEAVRNPLPAAGGREPQSKEEARQLAPQAFRRQQRAVTEADYAEVAQRHPEVQRAAATFRWTGSWTTVFLTVDRLG